LGIGDSVLGALQFLAEVIENAELSENADLACRPTLALATALNSVAWPEHFR
jgi:hypothetical protein